jgi:hypothetical protein
VTIRKSNLFKKIVLNIIIYYIICKTIRLQQLGTTRTSIIFSLLLFLQLRRKSDDYNDFGTYQKDVT